MRTLIFLLLSNICIAQTAMKLDLVVSRIPVNGPGNPKTDTLRTLLVIQNKSLGIVTKYDTLSLEYLETVGKCLVYKETYYGNQKYFLANYSLDDRIFWFVVPMRPFTNRRLYSLVIKI